jgi:hypothetical protein
MAATDDPLQSRDTLSVKANGVEISLKFDEKSAQQVVIQKGTGSSGLTITLPEAGADPSASVAAPAAAAAAKAEDESSEWDIVAHVEAFPGWKAVAEDELRRIPRPEWRYYVVLRHPISRKKGIFAGPHPECFQKILLGSGKSQLFGSAIDLNRQPGLTEAKRFWGLKEPRIQPLFFMPE